MKRTKSGDLHKLAFEILRQSLEEAKEGYVQTIRVERTGDNGLKISDDGRGIPLTADPVNLTLQTVNALCESFCVTVYRDGKCFRQD